MADDTVLPIPNLSLPQHLFVLSNTAFQEKHANARSKLLDGIQADRM
jgi:26S proteasome regulatory subunit N7